jgi:hypothetical protein
MKKAWLSLVLVLVLFLSMGMAVLASIDIYDINYNFDAGETEDALVVKWTGRLPFKIKANEFYSTKVKGQWETVTQVEERIQDKFLDLLVEDVKLSTVEADDPWRQYIFDPGQELVIINNQEYVRCWKAYFKIHIYSLDDLETPQSELRFITRFQNVFAGQIPDNWWQ